LTVGNYKSRAGLEPALSQHLATTSQKIK